MMENRREIGKITDAHAHIPGSEEARERIDCGIITMASAGTPAEAQSIIELCRLPGAENVLIPTFGLHPWHSAEWSVQEMIPYMETGRVVGEIGMDSIWCDVPLKHQQEVFEKQLLFAFERKKPVVLHTKDQERQIAELIRQYKNRYLVHWYSADHDLERYLDLDCFFSIGPDVIWNPVVQEVARNVREDRILVETDGMEAVRWAFEEGRRTGKLDSEIEFPVSVKKSLTQTLEKTAKIRGYEPGAMGEQIFKNFRDFLDFSD